MTVDEKKKNVLDVFNTIANEYVEYFGDDWEFLNEINQFIDLIPAGGKIIDLGCGSGYISKYISDRDLCPIGIDFSNKMIEIAKNNYPEIPFYQIDICDIDKYFKEKMFDGLIAIYTLYFIPKEQMDSVLNSICTVLKEGAKILIITQIGNGEQFVDEMLMPEGKREKSLFVNLYTEEQLFSLLEEHNIYIENYKCVKNENLDEIPGDGRMIILAKKGNNLLEI